MSEFLQEQPEGKEPESGKNEKYEFETRAAQTDDNTSTIFSAPTVHNDKHRTGKHILLRRALAATLCVLLLGGVTFGLYRFVDERKDESAESDGLTATTVFSYDQTQLAAFTVTHQYGTLSLTGKTEEKEGKPTQVWTLDGFDNTLIDQTSLVQLAGYTCALESYRSYSAADGIDYGFAAPRVTVSVKGSGVDDFTVLYGNTTADGKYCYTQLSFMPDTVYLVLADTVKGYELLPLNFAISTPIPAVTQTAANTKYFTDGTLSDFDTITVSGKNFAEPLVFAPNHDEKFSSYASYLVLSPKNRIADNVEDLRDLFGNTLASSGSVSFEQSAEAISAYGLDDPDWLITLKLGGETYTYRFKKSEEMVGNYYVAASTDRMVRTVTVSNLAFIDRTEKDFYTPLMVLESISDVSAFEMTGEVNHSFAVSTEDEGKTYNVTCDGTAIEGERFQTFYGNFISTTAIDFSTVQNTGNPSLTITLRHTGGEAPTVLTFTKVSESRYQYSVGGTAMGQITLTAYNRLVKEAKALAGE